MVAATPTLRVQSYDTASAFLASGRNADARSTGQRATLVHRIDPERIAVQYHDTDVVTYHADGGVTLNSGGWRSQTTKERINEYAPVYLRQERGIWYLSGDTVFQDGITIAADGTVTGAAPADAKQQSARLRKQITRYTRAYVAALFAGEVDAPSNGDCWYCLMKTADGNTLGEQSHNTDHLTGHFEESYFVPSLLARAIELRPTSPLARGCLYYLWGDGDRAGMSKWEREIGERDFSKSLRWYLLHCFGEAQ
jgi:hypothetical protein